ncbi:hypothetical protein BOS5A_230236 [Bosea sp. EC-HK365B]|nr:hypothetical protein BOSE21B_90314 [Bosea sp. 21B]CAD5298320.1 hypothetical protein BOSE7B_60353 [Bosea sp. 7B]VVT60959.1 hypothetical protein BOS5A_230236 [Bosea sp. EC-HK365B]VXB34736.1 hypothetical protein BOSE127_110351 [Bosea sp. 127]
MQCDGAQIRVVKSHLSFSRF